MTEKSSSQNIALVIRSTARVFVIMAMMASVAQRDRDHISPI